MATDVAAPQGLELWVESKSPARARARAEELRTILPWEEFAIRPAGWEAAGPPAGGRSVLLIDAEDARLDEVRGRAAAARSREGFAAVIVMGLAGDRPGPAIQLLADDRVAADDLWLDPWRAPEIISRVALLGRALSERAAAAELTELASAVGRGAEAAAEALETAARLQRRRLPERFPGVRGLDIHARYLAGVRAGGAFFDVAESPTGGVLSFVLTDATTYGLSSAVTQAILRAALQLNREEALRPWELVSRLRGELRDALAPGASLSVVYGVVQRHELRLRLVALGDARVWYAPPGQPFQEVGERRPALDAGEPQSEAETEVDLDPAGRLLVASAGFGAGLESARLAPFRERDPRDLLNELAFGVKRGLAGDELPPRDCAALVLDVQTRALRLTRQP